MRQVIADGSANRKIVILGGEVNACGIAGGSNNAPLAWRPTPHPSAWVRAAPLCIIATLLASTLAAETRASGEARQAQARPGGDRSAQFAQTTSSDPKTPPQALEQEHQRAEILARELAAVRHDLEILQTRLKEAGEESARARQAANSEIAELRKSLQRERDEVRRPMSAAESSAAELRKSMLRERSERLERDLARMRGDADPRTSPAATAKDEAGQPRQATDSGMAELKKSLQQERERAGRLEQDLAAARRNVETQTGLAARANDEATRLRQTADNDAGKLKKEHQRLEQDIAAARREVETQTALAAKARTEATELKQGGERGTTELQTSLQQERERAGRLEQDIAAARRNVETQTGLVARANDEATRLRQTADNDAGKLKKEHQRLEQDLAAARREVETQTALAAKARTEATELKQGGERGTAELQTSLQQERERAGRLEQDLAAARRNVETQTGLAARANDEATRLKQTADNDAGKLKKEHQRLEQDLAAARREVETQTALAAKAGGEARRLTLVAEQGAAELRTSLQQERGRVARLEQELAFARSTKKMPVAHQMAQDKQVETDAAKPVAAEAVAVANARGNSPGNPEDAQEMARLVVRASVLLGQGDISSARIVLERAAETGSAQASFMLAETYDPLILPQWGTYGTRGDATKARALYAKAEAGGIKEAKQRFDALRR